MTRSSTNELFTPYKEPKHEFRSSRKHFKTLSLDELRSPDFNLLFDQEYLEEEEAEEMAETMKQYMSKTRTDYGSGELRENTFSGSDNEDANEHIEKVLEIVDLFHVPNITVDQLMLRVFPISLTGAASHWLRNEPTGSIKTWEDLKTKFLNKYCPPGQTAKKMEEINNFQQEPDETLYQAWERFKELLMKCPQHYLTKIQETYESSLFTPALIINVCFDNALVDLGASISVMPLLTYLNLGLGELAHTRLTVELADRTVKYPKGIAENVLVGIGKFTFPVDFIILDMPKDIKVPLILRRSFLSTAYAKINVYKRNITLRVGEERIVFSSVKPTSSLIKRVYYMLSLRERMELDLEGRLMGETLVLNRSLDLFLEDYIDLNDLNKPFELRRNQEDVLMTTIEEGFEFTHVNFFPLLYVNVMSKKFHNYIIKDKMVYKGNNVVGALMNMPIFVGTFSIMTDFAVLEDMDAYRDNGIGDVIVGEPFLREVRIKTKRFEGIITLYKSDDEVTYQMVQSLLKVSEVDMMNGISHAYQKLKGFYKGVLNLGPRYL
ncbi:putative reverse transcriptase domain-containing protein [Tanacetum coccineum]